ncbi:MAG: hypothetical protein HKN79_01945, partial [Flavobacteriales bacterium]|nr:hypothetical protein [Flavobacteriales bacterium]
MVTDLDISYGNGACKHGSPKVRLTISDSIQLLNKTDWDAVLQNSNLFLTTSYLYALEQAMDETMEFRYIIYYCEQFTPIGIAYFQVVDLVDTGSRYAAQVRKLGSALGSKVVKELKIRSLVNGNVFHCGENGFLFSDKIERKEQIEMVENTANRLKQDGDLNSKVGIVVFKEFWPESFDMSEQLVKKRYHMFRMDMNMVMDIDPAWKSMDDYAAALTSKARTRLKSIRKRSDALVFKDMSAEEIRQRAPELNTLFHQVLENSSFTFGVLEIEAYAIWKDLLQDTLIFESVECEGKLVGFLSAFDCGEELEVHYVGLDYDCNRELGLYQR